MQSFRFPHQFFVLCACLLFSSPLLAQDDGNLEQPIYLTARLFEVRVPRKQASLTNQVFRLRTAAQTDDEKWLSNIKKAYPAATEVALLRTAQFRLFMRPRPGILVIGDAKLPHIELQFMVAQGLRDDDTINTMGLSEVNFYNGPRNTHPIPLSMMSQGFEIERGMSYFYTTDGVRLSHDWYTRFFRDGNGSPSYESFDPYLVLAISSETAKHVPLTFDETKSGALQAKATKKTDPQWPDAIKKQGLGGKIQVRTEINAEGKVTNVSIWQSTLPEGNAAALAAAKLWEFPTSELGGINAPVTAFVTFAIAPPEKKPEENKPVQPTGAETKPAEVAKPSATQPLSTKPTSVKPVAKKPPIKRLNK